MSDETNLQEMTVTMGGANLVEVAERDERAGSELSSFLCQGARQSERQTTQP